MNPTTASKPKRFTVTKHSTTLTVYPYTVKGRPCWRFAWRDNHGDTKWKYTTRRTKDEAKAAAQEKLDEIAFGDLAWSALSHARRRFLTAIHDDTHPEDEEQVRQFAYTLRREREARAADPAAQPAKSDQNG
jgi:hypothetical protein